MTVYFTIQEKIKNQEAYARYAEAADTIALLAQGVDS